MSSWHLSSWSLDVQHSAGYAWIALCFLLVSGDLMRVQLPWNLLCRTLQTSALLGRVVHSLQKIPYSAGPSFYCLTPRKFVMQLAVDSDV